MPRAEPLRGEIWDVRFPGFGEHPAAVMSVNPVNVRLGHVAVIPIAGTEGPRLTHVRVTPEAGLTQYDESYADVTGLQPIARGRLRRRRVCCRSVNWRPSRISCGPTSACEAKEAESVVAVPRPRGEKSPTRPSPSC